MSTKYNQIGVNYNQTRKADPYLAEKLLMYLQPKKDGLYLDIGCGTGNYTSALQKNGFWFIGIDPSIEMLQKAKQKNQEIEWKIGTAEDTGLSEHCIDGIVASLTIHHWANLNKAFIELSRILKPNGKLVIFTSSPNQMKGYWLNHYFPKMLADSMKKMPTLQTVKQAMATANIKITKTESYSIKPDLKDQFLYCGKQNPNLYLDKNIRHGISSFSAIANKQEINDGLEQLRQDIKSDKINDIIDSYKNDIGDYSFIIAQRQNN